MQLDKTRIVIRERALVDILDLALRVCRLRAWPLLLAFSAGIVPMMILNYWVLFALAEPHFQLGFPPVYVFFVVVLVALESPLATAAATLYLGKATFTDRPAVGEIVGDLRRSFFQLLRYQVLLRLYYLRWTYLSEIILLERDSIRRKTPNGKSRGRILHEGHEHDPVGRAFIVLQVGGLLFVAFWCSIYLIRNLLLSRWDWTFDLPMYTVYLQLVLWIVVAYFTVVRFLGYVDLRIRREGWEVELKMRAERERITRRWK